LQRFAVARRLKVTFASLFHELLRPGHNELVLGPKAIVPYSADKFELLINLKAFGLTIRSLCLSTPTR
jgi:hypothetical protein